MAGVARPVQHDDRPCRAAPPTTSMAGRSLGEFVDVARVPPAERDEIEATISPYATGVTALTAATIGTVACPPQVTMLTLAGAGARRG